MRACSAATHGRNERDLGSFARRIFPARKRAVHRHPQALGGQREAMPLAQLAVQSAEVRRTRGKGFAVAAGRVAQAGEIKHGHAGHFFTPEPFPALPKSRLPPRLPASFAGPITIACESALHMSYTVSAAT